MQAQEMQNKIEAKYKQNLLDVGGDDLEGSEEVDLKDFPALLVVPPCWVVSLFFTIIGLIALCLTVLSEHVGLATMDDKVKFLKYSSVPVISVAFTYCHIWLALWMTFYPIKFFGIFQIPGTNLGVPGWQGIIPQKTEKMARIATQLMTSKLIDMKQEFRKIDPRIFATQMDEAMHHSLERAIEKTADKYHKGLWQSIPSGVKEKLLSEAKKQAPLINERVMSEMQDRMEEIFDIEEFVVAFFLKDRTLLVDMFIACGYQELCFIRNSGATMGGLFGLVQMAVWMTWCTGECLQHPPLLHRLIVFPVIGFIVGVITNWLALFMIFNPVDPVNVCGMKVQGLFLTRQKQVALVYSKMVSSKILNPKNVLSTILKGPNSDVFFDIVDKHMHTCMDANAGVIGNTMASWVVGAEQYMEMREDFIDNVNEDLPKAMELAEDYTNKALNVASTMYHAMVALPSRDFEALLHPVFQEDEWKLILVGGVLGTGIGLLQAFFINSHG